MPPGFQIYISALPEQGASLPLPHYNSALSIDSADFETMRLLVIRLVA